MGVIKVFCSEKLVFGVLYGESALLEQARNMLEARYGPVDIESSEFYFSYTDYYNSEMGTPIFRKFFSFSGLVSPERLADIKKFSNSVEEKFLEGNRRKINLDPGLLNQGRLLLASTKNHAHRVPLSGGIYAEITLLFKRGGIEHLPWTYPDFRSGDYDKDLLAFRRKYSEQLKQH
ncbi:MAG: DUF4416 family protein [Spirochaetales bacterium]|nr:DUF4416 family protein [Spirochaetales bacterium]